MSESTDGGRSIEINSQQDFTILNSGLTVSALNYPVIAAIL